MRVLYYIGDPKREPNVENYPWAITTIQDS